MQMIIKYYKGYLSLAELEDMLNTSKNGTSAYKIIETFKKIGFESRGVKTSISSISPNNLILPCIAFVTIENRYNHYIVIYKINFKKKKILIADPSLTSLKFLSFEEFEKIWNNILIIMYPLKNIVRKKEVNFIDILIDNINLFKEFIPKLIIISSIMIILTFISSIGIKVFYDNINQNISFLFLIFLLFLIIEITKIASQYFRNKLMISLNKKIDVNMNLEIYNKVINLPYQFYRNRTTGEIISKISELDKVRNFINNLLLVLLMELPMVLISSILLFMIIPKLFLISLIIFIVYLLIFILSKYFLAKKVEKYYETRSNMLSFMHESINGFETVKGLNISKIITKKYEQKYIENLESIVELDSFVNLQQIMKDFNNNIGQLITMFIGIIFISKGDIQISDFLWFNSISTFFFSPIRNILNLDLNYEEAKKAYKKAYEITTDNDENKNIISAKGNIKINNLSYYYDDKKKILDGVNFEIKEGEKVLITGKSGSGKSTLMKILMKYYDIENDKVKIGLYDINDTKNILDDIIYISQNEVLFTDTLFNNLSLNNNGIDIVTKISNICYVNEIIKDNKLGYNMLIEENGFNISGGQKQRIVLARALLQKFNILIVDEGTNQIDVNLERKILKNVFRIFKDKTIIFVSHRLENMDLYDRLIEITEGKVTKNIYKCKS